MIHNNYIYICNLRPRSALALSTPGYAAAVVARATRERSTVPHFILTEFDEYDRCWSRY